MRTLTTKVATLCILAFAFHAQAKTDALNPVTDTPPANMRYLGTTGYLQTVTKKLAKPELIYTNIPRGHLNAHELITLQNRWGWAMPVAGEDQDLYQNDMKILYSSYYGGNGLNGNLGEGRAGSTEGESFKGIGPVKGMSSAFTEAGHNSGTIGLHEAIIEAIWSKLMALELPYGASNARAIVGVGSTMSDYTGPDSVRVIFVRDDFLRPGHFIINPTAEKAGRGEAELNRVRMAVKRLPYALPQPQGVQTKDTTTLLKNGLNEMIDRLAIQAGYQWAHGIYAAAMSPTNTSLTGAAADFGAFRAIDGYARIQMMDDARANGDCEEVVVLKELHESLELVAPVAWRPLLGTFAGWETRFWQTYSREVGQEMLSLSGSFPEFKDQLKEDPSAHQLAQLFVQIAKAGNEKIIPLWENPMPYGAGTYNLPRILNAMAKAPFTQEGLTQALSAEITDIGLKANLVQAYLAYYQKVEALAQGAGIRPTAARGYRLAAARIRNKKMEQIFSTPEYDTEIKRIVADYATSRKSGPVTQFIEQKVNVSRRNFKDAAPFTVVMDQHYNPATGEVQRRIFDARTGQAKLVSSNPNSVLESSHFEQSRTCADALRRRAI